VEFKGDEGVCLMKLKYLTIHIEHHLLNVFV